MLSEVIKKVSRQVISDITAVEPEIKLTRTEALQLCSAARTLVDAVQAGMLSGDLLKSAEACISVPLKPKKPAAKRAVKARK